ncbi:MAG TPA: hypothetical protein VHE13_15020 [Opitutus sp.]|nr:hypothetical protein [Opitutus sp.]
MTSSALTAPGRSARANTALRTSLRRALAGELARATPSAAKAAAPTAFLSSMSLETWCCVVAHLYAQSLATAGSGSRDTLASNR